MKTCRQVGGAGVHGDGRLMDRGGPHEQSDSLFTW